MIVWIGQTRFVSKSSLDRGRLGRLFLKARRMFVRDESRRAVLSLSEEEKQG
jgi:hypothetical protein